MNDLKDFVQLAQTGNKMRLAVIAANDDEVLGAVVEAKNFEMIEPILVGDVKEIDEILTALNENPNDYERIQADSLEDACHKGLSLFKEGKADFIMKGLIDTSILMKNVLNRDYGLRLDGLISHVMIYKYPLYSKLIGLTDGGMNIAPTLEQKKLIVDNAVRVFKALGYKEIRIAGLAAKEKVSEKMPVTVDADKLKALITDPAVIYEGPLALDLALSKEVAETKHFNSRVAGETDILLVPNIEVGNALGKSITYIGGGQSAGIIMGAKVPIVLVSRADTAETKLYSIALGKMIAEHEKGNEQ
ncbi:phosphate acyltransferase [Guggenheimella bovis]